MYLSNKRVNISLLYLNLNSLEGNGIRHQRGILFATLTHYNRWKSKRIRFYYTDGYVGKPQRVKVRSRPLPSCSNWRVYKIWKFYLKKFKSFIQKLWMQAYLPADEKSRRRWFSFHFWQDIIKLIRQHCRKIARILNTSKMVSKNWET